MLSSAAKCGVFPCGCVTSSALHARQNCTEMGAVVPIGTRAQKVSGHSQKALRTFDGFHCPALPFASTGSGRSVQTQQGRGGALAATCGDKVTLKILLANQVQFGEKHGVYGSHEKFGKWERPVEMQWSEAGWTIEIGGLRPNEKIEYKYVILKGNDAQWEGGSNRVMQLPSEAGAYELKAVWNQVEEEPTFSGSSGEVSGRQSNQSQTNSSSSNSEGSRKEEGELSEFVRGWQGREISFMKSNQHSGERQGKWDTSGLEGPAKQLIEGDQKAGNWWRKLEVAKGLIVPQEMGKAPSMEALVNTAIYLQWINSGAIACVEDGGHHRPNKHADISRQIFRQLEAEMGRKDITAHELMVIRRIHLRLPAFSEQFTQSVPLTRIRDIAHRNDIPHDLKQEIKHTIQNKLHRNAGPEDLVATEALLARVSQKPGEYSGDFLEQLRIFTGELKEFFNAGSLVDRLEALRGSFDAGQESVLNSFLDRKQKLESLDSSKHSAVAEACLGCLHSLTGLRAVLLNGLSSGLKDNDSDIAMRQKWRLSEIGLEDYSFVLLSRFINALDEAGGASMLAEEASKTNVSRMNHPLGAAVLGIRQLGLSGWQQAECSAIENELQAWQAAGIVQNEGDKEDVRTWALRLKATLDRARRLAEAYSEALLNIYPEPSLKLGRAFGIEDNTVRTFTEAEIRASVVFQLSKLCSVLLKALRLTAGNEGWDALVSGTAVGTLVEVTRIEPGALPAGSEKGGPLVLLVKEASGDEEVKAAGPQVAGVVLCQELPHLSHLGVRARQEGVILVTCDNPEKIADLKAMAGRPVKLEAAADRVEVSAYSGDVSTPAAAEGARASTQNGAGNGAARGGKVVKSKGGTMLKLEEVTVEQGGAKAAACGELARLATKGEATAKFRTPAGVCIPFGAMEEAIKSSGDSKAFEELVAKTETAKVDGGELDSVCQRLRELVSRQRPDGKLVSSIASALPREARLIVRSTANVEDLEGMSGAGLYDSIPNVKASEPEQFGAAVAQVWASLYTRRAVLSRRVAGVAQKEASMAVLVQELLQPTLSFVLHTVSPIDGDKDVVQAEVALGLGETLASGTRGTPWRLAASKGGKKVKTLAFANFSEELVVRDGNADGNMRRQTADYSKMPLSLDSTARTGLGTRLAAIGAFLEESLGGPQDVEGAVVGEDIFIVQSRPQPL